MRRHGLPYCSPVDGGGDTCETHLHRAVGGVIAEVIRLVHREGRVLAVLGGGDADPVLPAQNRSPSVGSSLEPLDGAPTPAVVADTAGAAAPGPVRLVHAG
jgi:hypothetical protein